MLVLVATPLVIDAPFRSTARSAVAEICDLGRRPENTGLSPRRNSVEVLVACRQANDIFHATLAIRCGLGLAGPEDLNRNRVLERGLSLF